MRERWARARRAANPKGWSLRVRVVAVLVCTVVLLSGVIAAIALTTLRASLVGQVDGELRMLASRVTMGGGSGSESEALLQGPGVPQGAMVIFAGPDAVSGAFLNDTFEAQELTLDEMQHIFESWVSGPNLELTPVAGQGEYRFLGGQRGAQTVIVGLPLERVDQTVSTVALTMGTVGVAGCLLLGSLAFLYLRRELRPLEKVASAAESIAGSPLDRGSVELQRVESPGPGAAREVGRLVSGFNSMIDGVDRAFQVREESEAKVRRFVADASHELRTPLASIRGYSELTRRMADDLPGDAVYALGRIESESERMTALVEDLLLLARLDEGEELLPAELDFSQVVADAVNDARAAGPEHAWGWTPPESSVMVMGDAGRLHQAVVNLLANARVHTPAGTEVAVSLTVSENDVTLVVADRGPGIAPEHVPTLFERFVRGDASRGRTAGSTGLGLAIVAAIVSGHGGRVGVASEPGNTRFSVELRRTVRLPE